MGLSLAITADLHWGHRRGGDATTALVDFLRARPPDVLVLGGDIGTGPLFGECLALFADLPCRKALVPGNHDLWVPPDDPGLDSLQMYERELPRTAAAAGFHFLDSAPLLLPEAGVALVGSINWYDYSWSLPGLRDKYPDEEHRLRSKRFPRGTHNDANYVRWPLDDARFTARVVAALERQLDEVLASVERAVVVTHHPPYYGLGFPRPGPRVELESFLWDAFCGNQAMGDVLARRADRIAFAFCGHTHRQRENTLGAIRGYNIGGDYHYKRLLWLDWPAGTVEAHEFGEPVE
jgi:predicted phosphohydrolase